MKYKVCILAAGAGTRNSWSKDTNKALLPIKNRAAISWIIDLYKDANEIVIAVGHNQKYLIDYLKIAHDEDKIRIVKVKNFSKKGSGPGQSLLECKKYLQVPFISHACDSICFHKLPKPNKNWIAYDIKNSDKHSYAVLESENKIFFKNKKKFKNKKVFTGIAGINNFKLFWKNLKQNTFYSKKFSDHLYFEKQMLDGFYNFDKDTKLLKIKWHDIGNDLDYLKISYFAKKNRNIVLPKKKEFIFFEKEKVIKFFADKKISDLRYKRAQIIKSFMPQRLKIKSNYLYYPYVKGKILSSLSSKNIFLYVLKSLKKSLWKSKRLNKSQLKNFYNECLKFYKDKTFNRVKMFNKKINLDQYDFINNKKVIPINKILKKINWKKLQIGIPVNFHGDTALNNIIYSKKKITLIDWRESFGKLLFYGDLYYDLAKIYHVLILPQFLNYGNNIRIKHNKKKIEFRFKKFENLENFLKIYDKFLQINNYDIKKIKLLSYLIFLNIAPLHDGKISKLFFLYGKLKLLEMLDENK
mgnify:FL=1